MAVLQIVRGLRPGDQLPIEGDEAVLGRHPDHCDIVLDSAAVSRQHAKIINELGSYYLEDLGSRNGTILNGVVIDGRKPLEEGDQVEICDLVFQFHSQSAEATQPLLQSAAGSLQPLLVDDGDTTSTSITSKIDVSSGRVGINLSAKPEVILKAMVEIGQNLGRALALDDVLPSLLDSLFSIFIQADRGFVVLCDPHDGTLIPKAFKYRREERDESPRISRTIISQAMRSGEAILSADVATDDRFDMAQSIADFPIRSMICAPLIDSEGKPLGVIQIDTLDRHGRFTAEDLEVLASIASQAAIAVHNAQLHDQAIKQQATQRDLDLARRVQHGLMPSEPPCIPGYQFYHYYAAANEVGGDYYDHVALSGGKLALVVADVSGKGVSAALLMAKLSSEARLHLANEADPANGLRHVSSTFARREWDDRFVTMVAILLDPTTHQMTLANAGHMAPLVRDAAGRVEAIGEEEAGLPVGVQADYPYRSVTRVLHPGDVVVLYTDGISEAMNHEGKLYGSERVCRQLAAGASDVTEMGPRILADVRQFANGQPQSDDMCLACFGRVS